MFGKSVWGVIVRGVIVRGVIVPGVIVRGVIVRGVIVRGVIVLLPANICGPRPDMDIISLLVSLSYICRDAYSDGLFSKDACHACMCECLYVCEYDTCC